MNDEKLKNKMAHSLILDNRKSLSISGVSDVDSFDEQVVVAYIEQGELIIKGNGLHINRLNIESGDLQIEGKIDSLSYSDNKSNIKGGFLSRLFK